MVVCFSVLPNDKWKRLQPHHCPEVDKRLEKWMDIFIIWLVLVRSKTLEVQRDEGMLTSQSQEILYLATLDIQTHHKLTLLALGWTPFPFFAFRIPKILQCHRFNKVLKIFFRDCGSY